MSFLYLFCSVCSLVNSTLFCSGLPSKIKMTLIVNHHIVPFMEHQMTYCFSQTSKMAENKMMKEIRYLTEIEYIGMDNRVGK